MDLSFLKHETCISLNKIFLGFERFRFYPKYYVAVNDKVIAQSASEIECLRCVKFLSGRAAHGRISEDALTYFVDTQNPPARFSKDLVKGVHEGWTVTYVAMQVAYYLGFSEVILIGLDHRYVHQGKPNETQVLRGPDPNHFSENYFGYGHRWDLPDLVRSEESYTLAQQVFEQDGRRIRDATVDGACQIFEKCDYRDLFFGESL